jgi:hypothetical protein
VKYYPLKYELPPGWKDATPHNAGLHISRTYIPHLAEGGVGNFRFS